MDRILRRELDAIARDNHSGAAELTLQALRLLAEWIRRNPKPSEQEALQVARALLLAQPFMAPLLRLANELALAIDTPNLSRSLPARVAKFGRLVRRAPSLVAHHFQKALGPDQHTFATYSYSSTVIAALVRARKYIAEVVCSESRPTNEGRRTAQRLTRGGISVLFATDAGLMSVLGQFGAFVTGADAIDRAGFINKTGTDVLALCAREGGIPVWVLADTTKFLPTSLGSKHWRSPRGPRPEVWPNPPAGVRNLNPYFGPANFGPHIRVVTEMGWMTPQQVRAELKKIRVSPRIWALTH